MDRHVTCWHQMVSRDSYGSEILISCQPLEEKVKSIGSARTGLAYWCKWKLEYQIERSELERFLQGDFEFCSQVHRACLPHWLRKRQPVQGGCRCGGCPHGQLRFSWRSACPVSSSNAGRTCRPQFARSRLFSSSSSAAVSSLPAR